MTRSIKDCFGTLDNVFPVGSEGIREVVPNCFDCQDRKECLQAALKTREGLQFRIDVLEREQISGFIGRLRRWSERKHLNRLMKLEEDKKNGL